MARCLHALAPGKSTLDKAAQIAPLRELLDAGWRPVQPLLFARRNA